MRRRYWLGCMVVVCLVAVLYFSLNPASPSSSEGVEEATRIEPIQRDHVMINGKLFFPIGFYHVSWAGSYEEKMQALEAIAAAGFNTMKPAIDLDDRAFLDRAQELGVYIIAEPNEDEGPLELIRAFDSHPAIIGWLIEDDFNARDYGVPPSIVAEKNEVIKNISPNKLTYISGTAASYDHDLASYMGLVDLMGLQMYAVPAEPLDKPDRYMNIAREKRADSNQLIIANLQAYASPGSRLPTIAEIRSMTYQALINGVSGVLYYTYFDDVWDMEDHPDLWAGMRDIAAELNALLPILLEGELFKVDSHTPLARVGYWVYQDKVYVAVANVSYTETAAVSIPLPDEAVAPATPLFERESNALYYKENYLVGSIPPAEAEVYVFETISDDSF